MFLVTIAGLSAFTGGIGWPIAATAIGLLVYFVYTDIIRRDLVSGNLEGLSTRLFVLGILGCIVYGGGVLILLQGILLREAQRDNARV